jgi:hypothetical protein
MHQVSHFFLMSAEVTPHTQFEAPHPRASGIIDDSAERLTDPDFDAPAKSVERTFQ